MRSLIDLSRDDLVGLLAEWGYPAYRARQIHGWIFGQYVETSEQMTNLPEPLRRQLAEWGAVWPLEIADSRLSRSGDTLKVLFRLADGATIEAVLMLYDRRRTLCISSQAGCAMGCTFCATGLDGLTRNLTAGEIVGQVLALSRQLAQRRDLATDRARANGSRVTNVVFMGMGEPLHNYGPVRDAIGVLTSPEAYGLGARNLTVSTIGVVPAMRRLALEGLQLRLAVSLHAPHDHLRIQLVPPGRRWPIRDIMAAADEYVERTGRRVTYEYVMLDGVNDTLELGRQLGRVLRGRHCHVNLIPFNPIPGQPYRPTPDDRVRAFATQVEASGVPVSVRVRRGVEMDAGCGQLSTRFKLASAPVALQAENSAA
ncbi:MAG: 23S rRNA (adenine(2503)-C(2))-methyltransferase RlmN [Caldilineaceae bacterium]|nr:23S rRNA (adenine(2503)-C(2))-methyltransferase RlmN [Caldilineaceae bacterium]